MLEEAKKHTINIFKKVYNELPPMVDVDLKKDMREKIEEILADNTVTLEELEDFMIFFGKKIWPYFQAFEEIYNIYHERLSEKIFLQRASKNIVKKVDLIKNTGVKFLDLVSGKVHHFFEHNERNERMEIMTLLVDLKQDIRKHATQAIMTHEKKSYEQKISKYSKMVADINVVIEDLHKFANEESENFFAEDIRDKVRSIEYSFAFLGPKINYHEILDLLDYYKGKKEEKKMRRII
ncbi:MAG: hypothetical protein WC070_02470 [Candidatus Magasanikbacteria bacterium]